MPDDVALCWDATTMPTVRMSIRARLGCDERIDVDDVIVSKPDVGKGRHNVCCMRVAVTKRDHRDLLHPTTVG